MTTKQNNGSSQVLALLMLVVVVIAAYLMSRALGSGADVAGLTPETEPATQGATEASDAANADADLDAVPPSALSEVDPAPLTREEVHEEPAAPDAVPAKVLGVAGKVIVLGGEPVEASRINGMIEVTVWGERSGTPIQVSVESGAFELAFAPDQQGRLRSLEGDRTIPTETSTLEMNFSEPGFAAEIGSTLMAKEDGTPATGQGTRVPFGTKDAIVYVVRAPMTRLSVVDKQSGTPLNGVRVVATREWMMEDARHPKGTGAMSLTKETQSPVTLHPPRSYVTSRSINALVSADGYAWTSVTLDLQTGGDRTVELERGGTLRVSVDGEVPSTGRLRLYGTAPGAPVNEMKVRGNEPIVYENLAAGEYSVRIELGDWFDSPKRLASQDVIVESNGDVNVDLAFAPIVAAPRARASGILVIPAGWDLKSYYASVELLSGSSDGSDQRHVLQKNDLKAVAGQPGSYSFAIPPKEVGQYEFDLSPLGWKQIYDLPPEGRTDLRFELPDPVELTVYVVEETNGEPADVDHVSWNPVWPKGSRGGGSMTQRDPTSPGVFRFNVTRGRINLSCWAAPYMHTSKTFDPRNTTEITLEVARASRASLTLRDGDNTIPWPEGAEYDVEPLNGGDGYYNSSGSGNGVRWFGVSKPGQYRLVLPEINGFEPHEPVEFEMLKGEQINLVIDLIRR